MSDINPNGLVLSRGIEESHVNCLHFAKPFAELIAFTDIDDMLIPPDPLKIHPTANIDLLEVFTKIFQLPAFYENSITFRVYFENTRKPAHFYSNTETFNLFYPM